MLASLAQLYASAHQLPDIRLGDDAPELPETLDVSNAEWQSIAQQVQQTLGSLDTYWAYFWHSAPTGVHDEPMCHSLADDLTDIYRDIKPGLRALEAEHEDSIEMVVFSWKEPLFATHWGQHAVSAMQALHSIVFLRGL